MSIHPKKRNKKGIPGWEVVIRYRKNGKRCRKAFVFRGTKADAKKFEAEKLIELESSAKPAASQADPRFFDFCVNEYKDHAKLHLKQSTWQRRSSQLSTLVLFFGEHRLSEITPARIDAYKRKRKTEDSLRLVSINNELRVLRRVLAFAREQRAIDLPHVRIQMFREGQQRPKVWSQEQVRALFDAARHLAPDILPILVFLANTGCRRGEALALRWDCVDQNQKIVRIWPVQAKAGDHNVEEWEPKTKRPREVPINDALRPWLDCQQPGQYVFPCPSTGTRYAYWPERKYQRAQQAAGLSGGVHTLRHTFASHFLKAQPDLFLLGRILGHSQTRVTELYSHLLPGHLERGRNAVSFTPEVGSAAHAASVRWGIASGD